MVDFNKIREERKAQMEQEKNKPAAPKRASWPVRVSHIIQYHLGELTTWEENFIYSQRSYVSEVQSASQDPENIDWDIVVSPKVQNKLEEIEDEYCSSICHAIRKSGV